MINNRFAVFSSKKDFFFYLLVLLSVRNFKRPRNRLLTVTFRSVTEIEQLLQTINSDDVSTTVNLYKMNNFFSHS